MWGSNISGLTWNLFVKWIPESSLYHILKLANLIWKQFVDCQRLNKLCSQTALPFQSSSSQLSYTEGNYNHPEVTMLAWWCVYVCVG